MRNQELNDLQARLAGVDLRVQKQTARIKNDAPASQKHDIVNPEIEQRLKRVEDAVGSFDKLSEDNRQ